MVTLNLYQYSGKPNVINKTLPTATQYNGLLYDSQNVLTPFVRIRKTDGVTFEPTFFNYAEISDLGRFYFVTDTIIENTNVIRLNLKLDVLKTYAAEILASTATITQRENANAYISNRENVYSIVPNFSKIDFSVNSPFDENGNIIMVTLKGN